MSLLTFLGLRQPKYNRTPLTLADVLHRTFVSGLAALSLYGIYLGYSVHEHVMSKGKGAFHLTSTYSSSLFLTLSSALCFGAIRVSLEALALNEADVKAREEAQVAEEARERSLAEAAQAALPKRS